MKTPRAPWPHILLLLLAPACFLALPDAKAQQGEVFRDPFRQPGSVAAGTGAGKAEVIPAVRGLELRGVIYDRKDSLVNIDGKIIGIGEFIHEYRLVHVEEREAVLAKKGKRIRLKLDRTAAQ